ncbi:MAG: GTP cyclohydrolase I [SAR324 cluster bacterium]|nr:GTP cyclohydrolase I [SAR324 cluster bacterium]MEC7887780.1 GTP cyclohydrolase I [SAR324 cluster bacterium]MED5435224.1 GTP cyclohydrolase I [SAR324 cluster bacterium]MED5482554.1 GTP cyclohydrolase I [SAR324 cluster bacterium]
MDKVKVRQGVQLLLEGLGVDLDSEHYRDTPERTANAWINELCSGLGEKKFSLTTFPVGANYESSMVVLQHIPVRSVCAHHLLPFYGEATVAYIPDERLCGLSKLSRIVDYFSRRPQVQEELTSDITNFLCEQLSPQGAGVIVKATHMCMAMRGVSHDGVMTTSSLKGLFLSQGNVRAEFMALANTQSLNKL